MNITVHIERLVLDGVPVAPADRPVLQAALEAELGRLLAAGGPGLAGWSSSATPLLAAEPLRLPADGAPGRLGEAIATAVHAAVRP
jgi:hypothetical protein